jgi:hypothetical protein
MPNVAIAMGEKFGHLMNAGDVGLPFTTLGFSKLPDRLTKELSEKSFSSNTAYNVPELLDVCEKPAHQAIVKEGVRIEKDAKGGEIFVIPVKPVKPGKLESILLELDNQPAGDWCREGGCWAGISIETE